MIPEAERFKACLGTYLQIDDWQAVDIILAAIVAHKLHGEMLWLRIIGASGSGKTEILRTCLSQNGYVETMETLTPSSIRRGLAMLKKDANGEYKQIQSQPTLLERIDGKLVITKELAPLLTQNHESKLAVFGLLRSVHDGELDADYGSMQGHIKQRCRFDWILGTTTYVDSQNQLEMQLGSRFTDLRWGTPLARKAAISQAISNLDNMEYIRNELSACMTTIIAHTQASKAENFKCESWLLDLCDIVAHLRTPVDRDKNKEVESEPMAEVGTRLGQNYAKIAKGLCMLGITDLQPYITRLAWDALPPVRACILKTFYELEQNGITPTQRMVQEHNPLQLSLSYVNTIMSDLKLVKCHELPWRERLFPDSKE